MPAAGDDLDGLRLRGLIVALRYRMDPGEPPRQNIAQVVAHGNCLLAASNWRGDVCGVTTSASRAATRGVAAHVAVLDAKEVKSVASFS